MIDTVSYDDAGKLTAVVVRFEQHCESQLPALRGAYVAAPRTLPHCDQREERR